MAKFEKAPLFGHRYFLRVLCLPPDLPPDQAGPAETGRHAVRLGRSKEPMKLDEVRQGRTAQDGASRITKPLLYR
jgi:hypothetical protein